MRPSKRMIPLLAMVAVLLNVDAAFGCSTKAGAYRTAMKSDLRNLVTAEDEFRATNGRYASDIGELQYKASTGTIAPRFDRIGADGWVATNAHTQLKGACHIYSGARPANVPEHVEEGAPWCDEPPADPAEVLVATLGPGTWIVLMILAMTAAKFLATTGTNWSALSLTGLLVVQSLVLLGTSSCTHGAALPSVPVLLLGLAIFVVALRRRISPRPVT
jgi:hypothetical protein